MVYSPYKNANYTERTVFEKMKKTAIVLLVFIMIFSLVACKRETPSPKVSIEGDAWVLRSVQDASEGGRIVYCSETISGVFDDAEVIDCVCVAGDGTFTINDKTSGTVFTGRYSLDETTDTTKVYEITTTSGARAIAGYTTYEGGDSERTLIMYFGNYTLTFYCK